MKTNIAFKSINYNVNAGKRTVACIMRVFIYGYFFEVTGIAKCSAEDTFDETKGKRIAESRAKKAIYKKAAFIYKNYADKHIKEVKNYATLSDFCTHLADKEKAHIDKLCN